MRKTILFISCFLAFFSAVNAQWQQTKGTAGETVYCFIASGNNLFVSTEFNGIFLSSNNGTSWSRVNKGLTDTSVISMATSGANLFAGTLTKGIFLSTNNGTNWQAINTGITNLRINSIVVSGSNLFVATSGGIFLSTNTGSSWSAVNTGLANTNLQCLALSGGNLFAGSYGGVYVSSNNGTSWSLANAGLPAYAVYSFATIGSDLFAGFYYGNTGVYHSSDNGTTWQPANTGLSKNAVNVLLVNGNDLYAGAAFGVFVSRDKAKSWSPLISGLTNLDAMSLVLSGNSLYAGTDGGGVFNCAVNDTIKGSVTTGSGNVSSGFVKLFSLAQGIHMAKADSVQIDPLGYYSFSNVLAGGSYLVWANCMGAYPTSIPTYGDSAAIWDSAHTLSVGFPSGSAIQNIHLRELSVISGKGEISGQLLQGNKYAKMKAAGDPIRGIDVSIGKKPKPISNIIAHTQTDVNGKYTFTGLPFGSYQVLVDIPGLPMDSTYSLTVTTTDTVFNKLDYWADSAKIYVNGTTGILNMSGIQNPVKIYPNPSTGTFIVEINSIEKQLIQVFNITGNLLLSQIMENGKSTINASGLAQGVYNVCLTTSVRGEGE